jgi:hypothetical protein
MRFSGKTEEKLFEDITGISEDATVPIGGAGKKNRFGF